MSFFSDLWDQFTSPTFNDPFTETLFFVLTQTTPLGDAYDAYNTVQDYYSLTSAMVAKGQNYNFSASWTDYAGHNASYGLTSGNDQGLGLDGNDSIWGYGGNDVIDGGTGADYMNGGPGADVYFVDNVGDQVDESKGGTDSYYIDAIFSSVTYTTPWGIEVLSLTGNAVIDAYGNGGDNILVGNGANNKLYGYDGDDILKGNGGDDTLDGGNNTAMGDSMYGGTGNDTYIVNSVYDYFTDYVDGNGGNGTDTVYVYSTGYDNIYLDSYNTIENMVLMYGANRGTGNNLANRIEGNALDNEIDGESDPVNAWSNDTLLGGAGNDILRGFGGADSLDGGTGNDTMYGGLGNDTYVVDSAGDVVIESADNAHGGGIDTVLSKIWSIDLSSYSNIDNITLLDGANKAKGDATANLITGNSGNNTLDGYLGLDTLVGGAGDDTYVVDLTNGNPDIVIENANEGTDTVRTFATFSLASLPNVENLILTDDFVNSDATGNDANNYIQGSQAANHLYGGAGNDTLDSFTAKFNYSIGGPDSLYGGTGDDTYIIANGQLQDGNGSSIDSIFENPNEGTDSIFYYNRNPFGGPPQFVIPENFENFTAASPISSITGNAANNVITGSWVADAIAGGAGNDTLIGDWGNDTLDGGDGNDALYGGAGIDSLYGGAGNDIVDGGDGNDTLSGDVNSAYRDTVRGGAGNDLLQSIYSSNNHLEGGTGDDTYWISIERPTIVENANEGTDLVQALDGTFTLPDNIENLFMRANSVAVVATGNGQNNRIESSSYNAQLRGMGGSDTLVGWQDGDTLDGGAGVDTLVGHGGDPLTDKSLGGGYYRYNDGASANTTYVVDAYVYPSSYVAWSDTIEEYEQSPFYDPNRYTYAGYNWGGNDTVVIDGTGVTGSGLVHDMTLQSSYLENRTLTNWTVWMEVRGTDAKNVLTNQSAVGMTLKGNGGHDTLIGGSGGDWLDGGSGYDSMVGGAGNDVYFIDSGGDTVVENANEGTDEVVTSVSAALSGAYANIENLTLTGSWNVDGTGNAANNRITGNARDNVLDGGAGADTLIGGDGSDTYYVDNAGDVVTETGSGWDRVSASASFTLGAGSAVERVDLTGSANIDVTGNEVSQRLVGNSGNNVLSGGGGDDTLAGGAGNDTFYVDGWGDAIWEAANEGTDSVYSSGSYGLSGNIENLTLTGTASINATGNGLANVINGNSGNNRINGNYGGDTIYGGAGNDTLSNGIDGNTWLDDNWLYGGTGDDNYWVDAFGHSQVVEYANEGIDTVMLEYASAYTLGAGSNIENLRMVENLAAPYGGVFSNVRATGNELNNVIDTSGLKSFYDSGNDTLNGGAGADTLIGGFGADIYILDNPGDVVVEGVNGSYGDEIHVGFSYTIASTVYVENLTLTGSAAINGTGNWMSNMIVGNGADNVLDGKGGAAGDTMSGGLGNDTYVVDNELDQVIETHHTALGGGVDVVMSSVNFALGDYLENLTLTGGGAINGTGNSAHNAITGNNAANVLSGGLYGDDTLNGGEGNDTLDGGSGNDVLDGGKGADSLIGGAGNDTFYVDDAGDVIVELVGEGIDNVRATASFVLTGGTEVEYITLDGSAGINATGNEYNTTISGNSGNNVLDGGAGADVVYGNDGADTLVYDPLDTLVGGTGWDMLRIDGAGVSLDLTAVPNAKISGFEVIDLTGSGKNTLTLDAAEVAALLDSASALKIKGNVGDKVMIAGTEQWTRGADVALFDGTFATYTNAGNTATMRVQSDVKVVLPPPSEISVSHLGTSGFRIWSDALLNPGSSGGDGGEGGGSVFSDLFGSALSSGDINGDGFADLIIGAPKANVNYESINWWKYDSAPQYDGQSSSTEMAYEAGAVYVIYGKAGGFAADTEVRTLIDAGVGFAVKGDGLQQGSSGTFAYDPIYAPNGSGTWGSTYHSDVYGVGWSVGAGDINGDGIDDLVTGAPRSWPLAPQGGWSAEPHSYSNKIGPYSRQGASFVVFGDGAGNVATSVGGYALDGTNGFDMVPEGVGSISGRSVGAIGDFNGDGFGDMVVGGFYKTQADGKWGGDRAGAAYIVFGAASGMPADVNLEGLASGDGSQGFEFWDYNGTITRVGYSVSSAGDVNGDGCDDLVVATQWNQGVYVVLGSPGGPGTGKLDASTFDNMTNGFYFYGGGPVATAGDFNGDGFDDMLFGNTSPGSGSSGVSVLFGSGTNAGLQFAANTVITGTDTWTYNGQTYSNDWSWSPGTSAVESNYGGDGTYGFSIKAPPSSGGFGQSLASAGDINGDGYDDIIIGDPYATVGGNTYAGTAYVVFGRAGGIGPDFDLSTLDGRNGFAITGSSAYESVGTAVASAGDLNGDGFDDIIVGASSYYGYSANGSAYVIFGRDFNGTAGTMGTAGSDTLAGGGAGTVVKAGNGDDVIEIGDGLFFRIDGGGGTDTLKFTGSGLALNFAGLQRNAVEGIEVIDLTGTGANSLQFSALTAQRLTDGGRLLTINGNADDQVTAIGAVADPGGSGGGYTAYSFGAMQLRIADAVAVATT